GLGVGGAAEPREARPQLLLALDALGQLPHDLLDGPGSQAELEQGGVQARIAPGAPPPRSGQRPHPGEAGEQTPTCGLLLVTLVPPGPDEIARPQLPGLQASFDLEDLTESERGSQDTGSDLPLAVLDLRAQRNLTLPCEQRGACDLAQVEPLGIGLGAGAAVRARLEVGRRRDRAGRGDAARPEDIVAKVHVRTPRGSRAVRRWLLASGAPPVAGPRRAALPVPSPQEGCAP